MSKAGLPNTGQYNISGAQTGVQNMLNSTPNIPKQSVDPKQRGGIVTVSGTTGGGGPRGESKNIGSPAASAAGGAGWQFALGSWLGGGVLEGINAFRKSTDEYLAEAGTSQANINGIAYTQQNSVDTGKIMSDYNNEAGTAWLTNPGKAITMLFGKGAARRRAEMAANYAGIQQTAQRDAAYTQFLRLDDAKKYGDTRDQSLYSAANGRLPKFVGGLKPTYTASGAMLGGEKNAKLSGGEVVYNKFEGTASEVGGPINNRDQEYGFLRASDGVLSNKAGIFGYSPADLFRATGNVQAAEDYMVASNMGKGRMKFKGGRLPRFDAGWASNFIPSAIGSLMSLGQILQASKNPPYKPNTYAANPYELEGLSTLAGLRINPYPIIQQLKGAESRLNRGIDMSGGLSGAQRAFSRLAGLNTTQNNIANLLSNIQQQNNAYRAQYAQSAINAGQANRQARMQANQWDLDYYSKAHAARLNGIQMGARNLIDQAQQYQRNEFSRTQFNDTLGLYKADLQQRREADEWQRNWMTSQA